MEEIERCESVEQNLLRLTGRREREIKSEREKVSERERLNWEKREGNGGRIDVRDWHRERETDLGNERGRKRGSVSSISCWHFLWLPRLTEVIKGRAGLIEGPISPLSVDTAKPSRHIPNRESPKRSSTWWSWSSSRSWSRPSSDPTSWVYLLSTQCTYIDYTFIYT